MAAAFDRRAGVRRAGRPSPRLRALALLLALGATLLPLAVLLQGLSLKAVEAIRQSPTLIEWIPLPPPPPPPPPPEQPRPAHHVSRPDPGAPAPHTAAPPPVRPDAPVQAPTATAPPPPPASFEGTGAAGDGTGTGAGAGSGGSGAGGAGGNRSGGPARTYATWVSEPGTQELLPYNPPRAARDRVNGSILLACLVLRTGRVTSCRVLREAPKGYGFGRAAKQASAIFLFHPPTRDGMPVEGWVEIPIAFNNRR